MNDTSCSSALGKTEVEKTARTELDSQVQEQLVHSTTPTHTDNIDADPPNLQPTTQESALVSLLSHCTDNKIFISPSITARSTSHAGLGVYVNLNRSPDPTSISTSTSKTSVSPKPPRIRRNERLIHVPTAALLTTQSIPESFLPRNIVKKKFTVHCALAAYLAFGGDEVKARYGGWMATWPGWEEFLVGMPIFWGQDSRAGCLDGEEKNEEEGEKVIWDRKGEVRAKKRRKTVSKKNGADTKPVNGVAPNIAGNNTMTETEITTTSNSNSTVKSTTSPRFSRGPGIDETTWLTLSSLQPPSMTPMSHQTSPPPAKETHLSNQAAKLRHCIKTIQTHLPTLEILSPSSHASYIHFLHMWAIVNTRCFYYLRPGQSPPSDSNEAMALCPFQDLFNHASPPIPISRPKSKTGATEDDQESGCIGSFDKRGFYVTADREYWHHGEELYLRYGRHSNDMLWMEYGFFLGDVRENGDDFVRLDAVVLRPEPAGGGFSQDQKRKLEKAGYLGEYTLRTEGVCYRTVIASYLGVLDDAAWARLVSGGFDPETNLKYASARMRAKRRIVQWVLKLRGEAEANLRVLLCEIADDEDVLVNAFVSGDDSDGDGDGMSMLTEEMQSAQGKVVQIARSRRDMCVRRWMQVFDLCMIVISAQEGECPGVFLLEDEKEQREEELKLTAAKFVEDLGKKHV